MTMAILRGRRRPPIKDPAKREVLPQKNPKEAETHIDATSMTKEVISQKIAKKKKKTEAFLQELNKIEPVDVSDLESLYSLEDEPRDISICSIVHIKSDDSSSKYSKESYSSDNDSERSICQST